MKPGRKHWLPKGPESVRVERCYRQLGETIRACREEAGMSQETLARRIGLTRTSICNIEAGRQRVMLHQIRKLCKALGVPPFQILWMLIS